VDGEQQKLLQVMLPVGLLEHLDRLRARNERTRRGEIKLALLAHFEQCGMPYQPGGGGGARGKGVRR
jgi:hypothetical protein